MIRPTALSDRIKSIKENLSLHYIPDDSLQDILGAGSRYDFTRPGLGVEFGNLIGRFANFLEAPTATPPVDASESTLTAVTKLLNPSFFPGENTTRTIRFRNTENRAFSTDGQHPALISYHLYDARQRLIEYDGPRSALPIQIRAGAELTVPVNIAAPAEPGDYRLDICLVEERLAWHAPALSVEICVRPQPHAISKPDIDPAPFDYPADFQRSIDFVRRALAGRTSPHILEVACGLYPVSAHLVPDGARVTAVDLCWAELQMASLIHNRQGSNIPVRFVCADVDELPFEPASFDAVVICAALHHFPDPTATLIRIRDYLRPSGVLVVVREPSSVNIEDPGYLGDLQRGYNEQQFVFEEYVAMLDAAGYVYESGQIDFGGSLKFIASARKPAPMQTNPAPWFPFGVAKLKTGGAVR